VLEFSWQELTILVLLVSMFCISMGVVIFVRAQNRRKH